MKNLIKNATKKELILVVVFVSIAVAFGTWAVLHIIELSKDGLINWKD